MNVVDDSLQDWSARHLEWMRISHYSENTVIVRERHLRYFLNWCVDRNLHFPDDISRPVVERYQAWLFRYRQENDKPLSVSSQRHRLGAVKHLFAYLSSKYRILYNPAGELKLPRDGQRIPREILSVSEVEQILIQPDLSTAQGLRDRAVLEIFYCCGIRRREVMNLDIYDIDFSRGLLMIREGKGRKDRVVPLAERCMSWIQKYLEEARPQLCMYPEEQALFQCMKSGHRIGYDAISGLVRKALKQAGISKKGSCHLFRHTAATLMLENGADIRIIQQFLGHNSLETTQIYTRVSITLLKNVHSLTHPASQRDAGPIQKSKQQAAASIQKSEDS